MSRKETESAVNVVQDGSQSSSCVRRTCESDSCWSWLVCGVCALCNIIICGLTYSYGILFPSLLDEFKQGKATTGLFDLHLTLRHKRFSEDFQSSFPFKEIGKALETRRSFFLCCFIDSTGWITSHGWNRCVQYAGG